MKFSKYISLVCIATLLIPLLALAVSAETAPVCQTYDPALEGIISSYYPIDREQGFIKGIAPGTPAGKVLSACLPGDVTLSQELVATGTVLQSPSAEGKPLTMVVTGDLNGDGIITITDMLMSKSYLLGETLSDPALCAGDVNTDGNLTITDFLQLKSHLLEQGNIGVQLNPIPQGDPLLVMVPNASEQWQPGNDQVVRYATADEAVATVSETGLITAGAAEGSTYVYGMDAEGMLLTRTMVTVLNEPLTVTLDPVRKTILKEHTFALIPRFNHPVSPVITWTTSDPAVASVDAQGNVTGIHYGSAVITATLPNGATAQANITVAPPLTALSTERKLYKVKPNASRTISLVQVPGEVGEEFIWTSSDESVVTVDSNGCITGVSYGTATITVTGKYSGLTASCSVKVCNVIQVALTFDDGPSQHTARLLNFLRENDVRVTFFLVGDRLRYYKNTVRQEVADGHEIGYHTYSHINQTTLTSEKIKEDFERANAELQALTGAEYTVWRTPGGAFDQRVLDAVPLPHILWSSDTVDYQTKNATAVCQHILNHSRDGCIMLMHDLYGTTVDGAIRAISIMNAGDYEFVTVTELLSRDGTPPEPSVNYRNGNS